MKQRRLTRSSVFSARRSGPLWPQPSPARVAGRLAGSFGSYLLYFFSKDTAPLGVRSSGRLKVTIRHCHAYSRVWTTHPVATRAANLVSYQLRSLADSGEFGGGKLGPQWALGATLEA